MFESRRFDEFGLLRGLVETELLNMIRGRQERQGRRSGGRLYERVAARRRRRPQGGCRRRSSRSAGRQATTVLTLHHGIVWRLQHSLILSLTMLFMRGGKVGIGRHDGKERRLVLLLLLLLLIAFIGRNHVSNALKPLINEHCR